jgi:hypothetical protein
MTKYTGIVRLIAAIGPNLKSWIFADGKFSFKRALLLIVSLLILLFSVEYFGAANTEIALTLLDSLSDILGYAQ